MRVHLYLYTNPNGITGTNHKPTPAPGEQTSVWVCFDTFEPGIVHGGMRSAQWALVETGGPTYLSTINRYAAVGGLTNGVPGVPPGCVMTVGPEPLYPDANGIIALARIDYWTPEEQTRGGTILVVPYGGDSGIVVDANGNPDYWWVHDVAEYGLSGHFGWDDTPVPDGDWMHYYACHSPVEAATWGSIKALYR